MSERASPGRRYRRAPPRSRAPRVPHSTIRIGPAGWSYGDWAGIVYPKPAPRGFDPLRYLADFFDCIEINSTYYRPASRQTASRWLDRVRDHDRFKFTAKLWRRFTHEREAAFTRGDVATVREALDVLHDGGKLGALLLQFPWSFRRTDENRQWLDDVVGAFQAYPLVLEVRHESWNVREFYEELAERGIGFVNIDQPLYKRSIKPSAIATAPVGYVRIHGRNYQEWFRKNTSPAARYNYLYSAEELKPWAARIQQVAKATWETYGITNNHYKGKGVANAVMLESMLAGTPMPAPPGVVAAFGDTLHGYVRADLNPS